MTTKLIQTLIPHLPRYAEEEGDYFSVKRSELIQHLINADCSQEVAENTLEMLENLLNTLAILKPDYLQRGEWCFMSFPAQLMALSVLTAMSDKDSRFFAENFWNTNGISNNKKDQQRDVLKLIENQRQQHHTKQTAPPIRYIHVAWSLIKHDGQVLFYQREDTKKHHDNKAGDYGLIDGRVNQLDMSAFSSSLHEKLDALQSPAVDLIKPALEQTLKRELAEEVGLIYEQHYHFKPWRNLKPYQQIQGTAPNHALTEYFLNLYAIELTLEGFCFLQQKVKHDESLAWFSIDEMVAGKTNDGKIAYIKALFADFADDRTALKQALLDLEESFSANYLLTQNKYGVTLPQTIQTSIFAGVLGKESELSVELDSEQLALLSGLAAHCRGFEFTNAHLTIEFYPYGWIKVQENTDLQTKLIQLTQHLSIQKTIVLESQQDCYFRLSVSPEIIFFDDTLFSYRVNQDDLKGVNNKIPCLIKREEMATALGKVKGAEIQKYISLSFATDLQKLRSVPYSTENDFGKKTKENYRKILHPDFINLGMKGLIRQNGNMNQICCDMLITRGD
ncbi:MAG: NUDIX hydrolase [Methylococcaceae bacterium]|nr:NUDIX hydrolase [Methylococcaceae bacterium]